ncbi:MAG TPA: HAMP domain-containing sensor histidine kinase [Polyangiaceae bacterium]|nr:HAMP domain-containing sensor histidine kinase [Polyangiaceae bacterium]
MNDAAARLASRVAAWLAVFSVATTLILGALLPSLLLLSSVAADAATERELVLLTVASATAMILVIGRLRRYRYLLRALALGSRSIEPFEMADLGREPGRLSRRWVLPHVFAQVSFMTWARPKTIALPTATSVAMLSGVFVAAASLLLYVVVRALFLRATELAPPEVMHEVVEAAERSGRARWRILRRLRTAVLTPVALVAVGTALIASAHVRRADEVAREATARTVSRAALELGPGVVESAGLTDAVAELDAFAFSVSLSDDPLPYRVEQGDDGSTVVTTPLDAGSAVLRFRDTTVPVLSRTSVLVALVTVLLAGALGGALGRAHTLDLQHATEGIRLLGTEAVIRGGRLPVRPPRFEVVLELEDAIERLAERFRVFARAQERAILAREAATRTRGLFFASVSHDLKSPLNAILGFAELVRLEPLTPGQQESLDVIAKRGRELLALIETILDAARVEAGQLALVVERIKVTDLFGDAFAKARDLVSDRPAEIVGEMGEGLTELPIDRVRMARALATLVAFAVKSARSGTVYVRASRDGDEHALVEVEVPAGGGRRTAVHLAKLLSEAGKPGGGEHRGLSLGLSLARSIVELHDGTLRVTSRPTGNPAFSLRLPLRA